MSHHRDDDNKKQGNSVHVESDSIMVGDNFVVTGDSATVTETTSGNVKNQQQKTLIVGGVGTTQEELDEMLVKIRFVDQAIERSRLDPDTLEEAQLDLGRLSNQLTASKTPNPKIVVRTARALYRLSPVIARAVLGLFTEPLATQILLNAGDLTVKFLNALKTHHGIS